MIDQRLLRENPSLISEGLKSRGMDVDLEPLQKFCKDLKELEEKRNSLQAQGNSIGKEVGQKIKQGLPHDSGRFQIFVLRAIKSKNKLE